MSLALLIVRAPVVDSSFGLYVSENDAHSLISQL